MPTLAPPTRIWPELFTPSCEQALPGNAAPEDAEEAEGKIGSGGPAPEPLQGGADSGGDSGEGTGAEGDGP